MEMDNLSKKKKNKIINQYILKGFGLIVVKNKINLAFLITF